MSEETLPTRNVQFGRNVEMVCMIKLCALVFNREVYNSVGEVGIRLLWQFGCVYSV